MGKSRINDLLDKYIKGTINAAEEQELSDIYNNLSFHSAEYPDDREEVRDRILLRLNKGIQPARQKHASRKLWNIAAMIALVFVFIGTGMYIYHDPAAEAKKVVKIVPVEAAILPGSNVATLTLGNGKSIQLNDSTIGRLAVQGNTVITKNANGQIAYQVLDQQAELNSPITYNTITTPSGGQFRVTLPDGSDVWLNAASSLKYPSRFEGTERHVELHGEAYFEVYKNKNKPFIVSAEQVDIKVLGTHFNVMAYTNEASVNTTLLEGAVSLTSRNVHQLLLPGQQGLASKTAGRILLRNVNAEDAIAWKNGYFSFRKENIKTAMNKIARWYNVEVEYQGDVDNKTLGGTISRAENITKLLDYLELTGIAKFKIEGRRIIVICK